MKTCFNTFMQIKKLWPLLLGRMLFQDLIRMHFIRSLGIPISDFKKMVITPQWNPCVHSLICEWTNICSNLKIGGYLSHLFEKWHKEGPQIHGRKNTEIQIHLSMLQSHWSTILLHSFIIKPKAYLFWSKKNLNVKHIYCWN